MDDLDCRRDDDRSRYEGRLDGEVVSVIEFAVRGPQMIITHTGTDPARRGHGFAARITRFALDDARRQGLVVVPRCPYTAAFLDEHPEYADLRAR